ncbi:hypothetical protein SEA_SCHMIDT_26 [Gordonia phage Schmidt]|uniref:Uncharacterized protein n=1 Tax=Gordonia phage Schmidt TaxID=2301697 RepID=A0A385E2L4_9CAUD|nr:hypothetical protein KDJ59_gp26 [Gordonia phage Schmidt]AXQ65148.1 hypothetical protein SEA_SCHMIDT_26 [Gordonia phage Schmidt]
MSNLFTWEGGTYGYFEDVDDLQSGSAAADRAMVWDGSQYRKVWQRPNDWRLVNSATHRGTGNVYNTITSMVADAGYPGTETFGSGLLVPEQCPPFSATITATVNYSGGIAVSTNVRILMNGGEVLATSANGSGGSATVTAYVWVYPLDYFELQFRGEGQLFQYPTVNTATLTLLAQNY